MQHGSLTTKSRLEGPDVWQFGRSEKGPNGKRVYRKRVVHPVIVEALEKWKEHQRYRQPGDWVFASDCRRGRQPYWGQAILRKYIRTQGTRTWNRKEVRLAHLPAGRQVLDSLERRRHRVQGDGRNFCGTPHCDRRSMSIPRRLRGRSKRPRRRGRSHVASFLSRTQSSSCARARSERKRPTFDILELAELQLLLSKLAVRERTLALLDAATGLRVSELLALRLCDVDFENLELRVTRSIWHQVLGNCKTEASAKPVPMDSYMAEDLLRWRRQSVYASDDHYVFASETMRGKQPYWPDNLMKRHIQPVAKAIGIHKKIGWHTFRHSFGTLLKANGEDVKTVQELLRHANSRITLDVYTQAVNSNKRAAQSKVVRMMVSDVGQTVEEKYPQTQQ